jgi:nucleotide-binding universal stress UspA family protein
MRILVAVDDSAHSERAVRFVARMRWPAGSRVIVVNVLAPVLTPPTGGGESGVPLLIEVTEQQRQQGVALTARAEKVLREAGVTAESRMPTGDPRDAILRLVQDERADLLVLGSHGRTGFAKLLLGSVSSHAVTHAHCSVLVVKEGLDEHR